MATKDKTKGRRYTASERARAMQIYREHGPSQASRRLGIPYETVRRWARDSGEVKPAQTPHEQTARSHAMATTRVAAKWADTRLTEADNAGHAAQLARERILDVLMTDDHQMLRAAVNAYEILINKAEMMSGQATERIAVWAEQDLDRELKELVKTLEDSKRKELPASKRMLQGDSLAEVIDVTELVVVDEP
jgi:transposase-like protein